MSPSDRLKNELTQIAVALLAGEQWIAEDRLRLLDVVTIIDKACDQANAALLLEYELAELNDAVRAGDDSISPEDFLRVVFGKRDPLDLGERG